MPSQSQAEDSTLSQPFEQIDYTELDEPEPEPEPEPELYQPSSSWISIKGAITHSLFSWIQGKSEDTVLLNPCFKKPSSVDGEGIEYSIYCIHGTADGSFAFKKMITRLLENKPRTSTNWLPESVSKIYLVAFSRRYQGLSINDFAEQLKSKIIKNGDKHVILKGHSRGGLVAAKFAQDMAREIGVTVHGVLPFCSPWNGSPLAVAPLTAFSSSVTEMMPNSEFLDSLRSSITRSDEESRKYFCFAVENDSIVPTEDSFMKENAHSVFLIPKHGHLSILTSSKIIPYVSDCLEAITKRMFVRTMDEKRTIKTSCFEIEAEIIALKNRSHLYSIEAKIKILDDLKVLLRNMCEGERGELFLETKTVGEFIRRYIETIEPNTELSLYDILGQQLNPQLTLFKPAPSKSVECIEMLIQAYQDILLPEKIPMSLNL